MLELEQSPEHLSSNRKLFNIQKLNKTPNKTTYQEGKRTQQIIDQLNLSDENKKKLLKLRTFREFTDIS